MKGISPLTLGLILLALPVLAWLWWTSEDAEAPVGAVQRDPGTAVAPAPGQEAAPRVLRLPPMEAFSVMVDRPLFAATRHPLAAFEEPPPVLEEEVDLPPPPPEDNIADRYRLIGTVEEDGRIFALLAGSSGTFVRVRRGDRVENWTVSAINRQRVLMVNGDRATELMLVPEGLR
ncbi:hypothetical protein [Geminicoccus roseus]|uniref:hypothetical protein n=1 Tax=Geminicoccus roseus TaxID=404900 RepID=UPI0004067F4D|nr:hypothetical protein [Geminicoccus roseus]